MRFDELATAAALGTATRPVRVQDLPDAVAATLPGGDPATVALDAAASYALVRRAGVANGPATPLRLPPASRPEAPAAFVSLLRRLRATHALRQALKPQALRMLAERGLTLPPDLARELLDEVGQPGSPRVLLGAALDERLWALVRLDSALTGRLERSGASAEPLGAAVWEEGTLAQRVAYLAAVRATDAAAGLALVQGLAWPKETAEARGQFVQALATGLSLADEPLLERALDDRAKGVREAAASLLAGLRGSAFLARAEALAAAHLSRRPRLLRSTQTIATGIPPTATTARDGYPDGKPDTPSFGRMRLSHVVSLVPTDRWPALLGATASELASAPLECEGVPEMISGAWGAAARRWGDADLARALLKADPTAVAALAHLLPPAEGMGHVTRLLLTQPAGVLLTTLLPERLDAAATDALLGVADAWSRNPNSVNQLLGGLAGLIAARAESATSGTAERLRQIAGRVSPDERALRRALADATDLLQLRAALDEALAPYPVLTTITADEEPT